MIPIFRWTRFLLPLAVAYLFCAESFGQQIAKQESTFVQASDLNAPIAVSGTMLFTDNGSERTPYSFRIRASATNVSSCPVLLFKVSFGLSSDKSSDPAPQDYDRDYFFSPDPLSTGAAAEIEVSLKNYGSRVSGSPSPRVTVVPEVDVVQYEDGRVWGDAEALEKYVQARKTALYNLNALQKAYAESGDQGFVKELTRTQDTVPPIAALQYIYQQKGVDKAETTAWTMIEAASRHQREIETRSQDGTSCISISK